jgi:hypothetical protein
MMPSKISQFEQQAFPPVIWEPMMNYPYPQTMFLWFA